MKKIEFVILLLIIIAASLLRFPLVAQGFFAFTYDQGRDLLAVRQIVINHHPTLIGPTTGLPGIFYGPWWYYFLSPIFFISHGNPLTITLFFGLLGIITLGLLYYLALKLTKSNLISLATTAIAATSQSFLIGSTQIWSPSLVPPLMAIYIFSLYQIFKNSSKIWFLVLGLSTGFIFDSEAAFGLMAVLSTLFASLLFKKDFFKKKYLLFFLGLLLVFLPRIMFDLRHDFLITQAVVNWFESPTVYQQELTLFQRVSNRVDLFFLNFAQTFSQSSKLKAILPMAFIFLSIVAVRSKLIKDKLFKFLTIVLLLIYLGFTLYPDAVWDYYLAGLPMIFLSLFAILAKYLLTKSKILTILILIITVVINFHPQLLSPFAITWQGDGAIYKNQTQILENLKSQLLGDYSLFVYTPAGLDYPFEYLISLYHDRGEIDLPKNNQKRMYLIIRDDPSHLYLPVGWYGDKVKNNTILLERKVETGNIIVEKHQVK